MSLIFLSSGLFLGWSLGANDAANVFGTAVGTKMLRFRTAALVCSVFLVLGAVVGGAGTTRTLGSLGAVNAPAGAFMVTFAAAFTVFWMTRLKLPVSTSQAVVGAIIGWNFFTGSLTDSGALVKIILTWIVCPLLSALFVIVIYTVARVVLKRQRIHILRLDTYTRFGLLVIGAFGSYSLGANNIANVMGVFVSVSPFTDFNFYGLFTISGLQQLFLVGALAIAVGVYTYSKKVMLTVGKGLFRLSPLMALIVVFAHSLVLFLFSSESLQSWLLAHHLPSIPLVPVSSSQAIVGGVLGIALVKGGRGVHYRTLGGISLGWVTVPIIAGLISFVALFFLQNVFNQEVSRKTPYVINDQVLEHVAELNILDEGLMAFVGQNFTNPIRLDSKLKKSTGLTESERRKVIKAARVIDLYIDPRVLGLKLDPTWFTPAQWEALKQLQDHRFTYQWELFEALAQRSSDWSLKPNTKLNKIYNRDLTELRQVLIQVFEDREDEDLE